MIILVFVIAAYLIGSIPTGYIFGRILKGIDVRCHGSGNVGATNVVRTVGVIPGIVVLILDISKGLAAVIFLPALLSQFFPAAAKNCSFFPVLTGAAVISGHVWPCFLKFRGGKGVATTAGVLAGLSPGIFLSCFGVWLIIFAIWKYVSVASIAASIALPIFAITAKKEIGFVIFCSLLCLMSVYAHRLNIKRLIQGTESKIIKVKKR